MTSDASADTESLLTSQDHSNELSKKRKRNAPVDTSQEKKDPNDSDICIQSFLNRVPQINEHFDIVDILGDGTFSYVFHGRAKKDPSASYALKYIIPTSASWRITNEIKYLKRLGGKNNVCDIKCIVRHQDSVVLVLPYFSTTRFIKIVQASNQSEIQRYLKALFASLAHVHKHNVIHRDIKPSNFLYDREKQTFLLVDFGLAEDLKDDSEKENKAEPPRDKRKLAPVSRPVKTEFITSRESRKPTVLRDRSPKIVDKKKPNLSVSINKYGKNNEQISPRSSKTKPKASKDCTHPFSEICNTCILKPSQEASRAGTPGFRSPEMLMKHPGQTMAVDMWAAGVIFLSLLSGRYPFFKAADDLTSLSQIITLLGSAIVIDAAKSIGKHLILAKPSEGYDIKSMCEKLRLSSHISTCKICGTVASEDRTKSCKLQPFVDPAFDLLKKCLDPNPNSRITAEKALTHSFFNCFPPPPLKLKVLTQSQSQ